MTGVDMLPTILTIDGEYFDYTDPEHSRFGIRAVAHGLSNTCRFTGQCKRFYSVAQHSLLVSMLLEAYTTYEQLAGLLHDGAEAFMVDVPRPLKYMLPDYRDIEARVDRSVLNRFGIAYPVLPVVKQADRCALYLEQRELMAPHKDKWDVETEFYGMEYDFQKLQRWLDEMTPVEAKAQFIIRYNDLTGSNEPLT
jgi:hypothetical protein